MSWEGELLSWERGGVSFEALCLLRHKQTRKKRQAITNGMATAGIKINRISFLGFSCVSEIITETRSNYIQNENYFIFTATRAVKFLVRGTLHTRGSVCFVHAAAGSSRRGMLLALKQLTFECLEAEPKGRRSVLI